MKNIAPPFQPKWKFGAATVCLRLCFLGLGVCSAVPAFGNTLNVGSDAGLRSALDPVNGAQSGDTIAFTGNITLNADLPVVQRSITIEGNGFTLDGNSHFRGFLVAAFIPGSATPSFGS